MRVSKNSGIDLEDRVERAVSELLASGKLGLRSRCCKVFLHKGYYSKDRQKCITVDVSIELIPPGTSKPALIWIWECKNYAEAVPVSDLEEFHAKLEQIGADRTKGTMITTSRYQDSAVRYAMSKGIGLTRLIDGGKIMIERVPGWYVAVRGCQGHRALTHDEVSEGALSWNSFIDPLPESSKEYFFSCLPVVEVYSTSVAASMEVELQGLVKEFGWLIRSKASTMLLRLLRGRYS